MATAVTIVVGDTTPDLVAALSNAGGAQDLTNATVQMILKRRSCPSVTLPCTIDGPPTAGIVRHVWQSGETGQAGSYGLAFVVTYFNGTQQTFPNVGSLTVLIRSALP